MNRLNTSRRSQLENSAASKGLRFNRPSFCLDGAEGDDEILIDRPLSGSLLTAANHDYIVFVLNKHAARAKCVQPIDIRRFAERFVQLNGDINYHERFKNVGGEYRLVKLFARSLIV